MALLKMMIFPTSRLVGYVSFPWRVTISGTIFGRHLSNRQAKRAREESESGSDSEEESIPKVAWETTNPPVGWETTNGFGWFKLCLFFVGVAAVCNG